MSKTDRSLRSWITQSFNGSALISEKWTNELLRLDTISVKFSGFEVKYSFFQLFGVTK